MLYTVNYEEVSRSEFSRALRGVTSKFRVDNSYVTDCEEFQITEYEDGSSCETCDNSKELVIA